MDVVYNYAIIPIQPVKKHLEKFGAPLGIQAILVAPYAFTLPGAIAVLSDRAFEFAMSRASVEDQMKVNRWMLERLRSQTL
jgi:hypothetical protein